MPFNSSHRAIADVMASSGEEVSIAAQSGSENFGWPKFEGNIFRSAVSPYQTQLQDATIIYQDNKRSAVPATAFDWAYVLAFLVPWIFSLAASLYVKNVYPTIAGTTLGTAFCLLLPYTTQVPGHPGYDNGVIATHNAALVPGDDEIYPEYYALWVLYGTGFILLLLAAPGPFPRTVAILGAVCAIAYLTTFLSMIQSPTTITPLPIFTYLFAAATIISATLPVTQPTKGPYRILS